MPLVKWGFVWADYTARTGIVFYGYAGLVMTFKLRKKKNISSDWNVRVHDVKWYPSDHSCVRRNMNIVRPQQMPPLMVRKAAWRR